MAVGESGWVEVFENRHLVAGEHAVVGCYERKKLN